MRRSLLLLLLSALVSCGIAFADEEVKSEQLEEITVTATKTQRKAEEVPASVDIITKENISKSKGQNIGELLGGLSGVQAETKNGAYDTHIIIRGAGAKAAYGVREIMIMVDGVPITDPDSLARLDVLDTALIERIEVVKGPNSTLYGANAAGGVINIITKNPLTYQGLGLRLGYGANNTEDYHLQYGGSYKNLYFLLSGSRRSTDSWRRWNEFSTNQFNAKLNYIVDESSDMEFSMGYTKADLQLPGSLTKAQFEQDPTQRTSEWPNSGRYSKATRAAIGYRKELSGGSEIKGQLYAQSWEHYHPVPTKINDGGAMVFGGELQESFPHKLFGMKSSLMAGVSGQKDVRDANAYTYRDTVTTVVNANTVAIPPYSTSDAAGDLMETSDNTVDKWGIYLQESLWPSDRAILDIGVRYDRVMFDLDKETYKEWGFMTSKAGVNYFNYKDIRQSTHIAKTWDELSPRIGLTYAITNGTNIYGTVSTGFQTPAQAELGTNENLKPQKAVNYETGLKGKFGNGMSADLALFYTAIDDEVIKLMDNAGASYYDNAGKTIHQGVEASGRLRLMDKISLCLNYAYSDFTFKDFKEMEKTGFPPAINVLSRDGNQIPLVPRHKYTASLNYNHPAGFYGKLASDTWGEYFVNTANTETYNGFTVVKWRVGYEKKTYSLYLQVDNIFDKKYASEVTQSYGKTSYSPGAPRTWMAGISYNF
ncbi:MAG: TonB-dependent receptor [Thermodesulfovibrionales bacterium]|nr:TonB-dependent receptor [Thermodesulfovibrionales bacterium]